MRCDAQIFTFNIKISRVKACVANNISLLCEDIDIIGIYGLRGHLWLNLEGKNGGYCRKTAYFWHFMRRNKDSMFHSGHGADWIHPWRPSPFVPINFKKSSNPDAITNEELWNKNSHLSLLQVCHWSSKWVDISWFDRYSDRGNLSVFFSFFMYAWVSYTFYILVYSLWTPSTDAMFLFFWWTHSTRMRIHRRYSLLIFYVFLIRKDVWDYSYAQPSKSSFIQIVEKYSNSNIEIHTFNQVNRFW